MNFLVFVPWLFFFLFWSSLGNNTGVSGSSGFGFLSGGSVGHAVLHEAVLLVFLGIACQLVWELNFFFLFMYGNDFLKFLEYTAGNSLEYHL
ncbi:hypothetical protein BDP67DRAFT_172576 [Colletotrichum lupini]|nr:hypothetical protein BDP67DRAFT_172576 [Colletotrichum lupini]